MRFGKLDLALTFFHFRLIVAGTLNNPVAWIGIVNFAARPSWTSAGIVLVAVLASYAVRNGRLFHQAARDKVKVEQFLDRYSGAVFVPIPAAALSHLFDFSFMIPSYIRPRRFVDYFIRNHVHLFLTKRGTAGQVFGSPCAFVSPIAQDAYIFLRGDVEEMPALGRFVLLHELGHAAAIYATNAQRNLVGLLPLYVSILWTVANASWTPLLIAWTLLHLGLTATIGSAMFQVYRNRQRFNAEIVADYIAARHLRQSDLDLIIAAGDIDKIVRRDPSLTDGETAWRRRILEETLTRLSRGEAIDIPDIYMRETFRPPALFILYLCLHMAYLTTFAILNPYAWWIAGLLTLPAVLFFLRGGVRDARLRIDLDRRTGRNLWARHRDRVADQPQALG